jgi:hypothetical protein
MFNLVRPDFEVINTMQVKFILAPFFSFYIQSSATQISKSTSFVSKNDSLVTFSGESGVERGKSLKLKDKNTLEISFIKQIAPGDVLRRLAISYFINDLFSIKYNSFQRVPF